MTRFGVMFTLRVSIDDFATQYVTCSLMVLVYMRDVDTLFLIVFIAAVGSLQARVFINAVGSLSELVLL